MPMEKELIVEWFGREEDHDPSLTPYILTDSLFEEHGMSVHRFSHPETPEDFADRLKIFNAIYCRFPEFALYLIDEDN